MYVSLAKPILVKNSPKKSSNLRSTMPRAAKQKDPNAPKRPLSAFFIFSQDERPKIKSQNAALSVADVAKVIGEKWRSAPEDLKRRYEKAAKEAKERYEIEMQAYKKTAEYAQSMQQHHPKAQRA